MRLLISLFAAFAFLTVKSQTPVPAGFVHNVQFSPLMYNNQLTDIGRPNSKWHLGRYSGLTFSFSFFNGGSATVLAAPIGLQLSRELNRNLFVFAGVSAALAYINFNNSFRDLNLNKSYPGSMFNANGFGIFSKAEVGLMFVNDEKTFSISGSIGVSSSSYPAYPVFRSNEAKQQAGKNYRQP